MQSFETMPVRDVIRFLVDTITESKDAIATLDPVVDDELLAVCKKALKQEEHTLIIYITKASELSIGYSDLLPPGHPLRKVD